MSQISAKDVMALRNATGLGMMECKKALEETGGDAEAATELLRKKLKGKMDARTDRAAGEGRLALAVEGETAAIVEIRAETDFTARNDEFIAMTEAVAREALALPAGAISPNEAIAAAIDQIRIKTGENVSFSRGLKLQGEPGDRFGSYVHHDGKTAALVQASGDVGDELLRDVCMHIAAVMPRPLGVTAEDIPQDVVEKERAFALEQAMESGKPQEIAEKIVEGKMRKFFESVALLEQPFVKDPDRKVKELLPPGAAVKRFVRWQLGETD